jgi:hypothetical protein
VWVKDLKGRLICVAQFVEAVSSRCESLREHTERKRAEARIKQGENKIDQIAAGVAPPALEMDDGSRTLAPMPMPGFVGAGLAGLRRVGPVATDDASEPPPLKQVHPEPPEDEGPDPMALYQAKRRTERQQQAEAERLAELSQIEAAMRRSALEQQEQLNEEGGWILRRAAG